MRKIAIIGGSYLQYPLVLKAKEMLIETHCFAWEEGAICKGVADYFYPISIIEKEKILEQCVKIGINGIVSIASDLAVPTVCFIADKMNLIGNPLSLVKYTTDKYLMKSKILQSGINTSKFILYDDNIETLAKFKYPLIVKPTDRSGSRGVIKVNSKDDIGSAVKRALKESFSRRVIIEEYIEGEEVSVETVSWKGEHYVLAVTDKVTTGAPYFVELEHHQPSLLPKTILDKLKKETVRLLNVLGVLYGASHAEFRITSNGDIYLIEVGARMGGDFIGSDLVYLSTGFDFLKSVIEIALGEFNEPICCQAKQASGIYFLSKETERLLKVIQNKEKYDNIVRAEITSDELLNVKQSSDRSGYLIYQSNKKEIFN